MARKILEQQQTRERRIRRTRAKISGTASCPRFSVFRSNRFDYAQLIDDTHGTTLVAASVKELPAGAKKTPKKDQARLLGEYLAKKAHVAGIVKAVFDRRSYRYHGRIAAIAEGARAGGLKI